jgi:predicted permease
MFLIALSTVLVMLFYALPGFLMVKTKLVSEDAISSFAKLLMYVCQPALIIYSFMQVDFSFGLLFDMLVVFFFVLLVLVAVILAARFALRKKIAEVKYRIYILAMCFSNCAFMGVPILEALLPDYPQAVAFSAMFSLVMNILGWTLASAIITNNSKYMSVKKIVLNPAVLALIVAVPVFVTGVKLPETISDMVTLLGRMTTPLCMIIMGMRLAKASLRSVFGRWVQYFICFAKQIVLPVIVLLLLLPLPVDYNLKVSVYIMFACPVASVVLNFAEMLGEGQEHAANFVLLSTALSALTVPLMVLLV